LLFSRALVGALCCLLGTGEEKNGEAQCVCARRSGAGQAPKASRGQMWSTLPQPPTPREPAVVLGLIVEGLAAAGPPLCGRRPTHIIRPRAGPSHCLTDQYQRCWTRHPGFGPGQTNTTRLVAGLLVRAACRYGGPRWTRLRRTDPSRSFDHGCGSPWSALRRSKERSRNANEASLLALPRTGPGAGWDCWIWPIRPTSSRAGSTDDGAGRLSGL